MAVLSQASRWKPSCPPLWTRGCGTVQQAHRRQRRRWYEYVVCHSLRRRVCGQLRQRHLMHLLLLPSRPQLDWMIRRAQALLTCRLSPQAQLAQVQAPQRHCSLHLCASVLLAWRCRGRQPTRRCQWSSLQRWPSSCAASPHSSLLHSCGVCEPSLPRPPCEGQPLGGPRQPLQLPCHQLCPCPPRLLYLRRR